MLEFIKNKLGYTKTWQVLGISKSSLHRYLSGERRISNNLVYKLLEQLSPVEFEDIVSSWDKLKAPGIVKDNGSIDYSLAQHISTDKSGDIRVDNGCST